MRRLVWLGMALAMTGCGFHAGMNEAKIVGEDEITVPGVYAHGHGVYQCTESWLQNCVELAVSQCATYGGTRTQMHIQSTSFDRMVAGRAYSRYVFSCIEPAQPAAAKQ